MFNIFDWGFCFGVVGLKSFAGMFRFVPSVLAVCAGVSLYAFLQVDAIVNQTLYQYSLQFSYAWANPYWDMAHILVAMGWLIAGLSVAFQVYLLLPKKAVPGSEAEQTELRDDERWSTFRLGDGSTIRVKLIVKGAKRLNKYSEDGWPIYTVDTEPIVEVVDVPEELKVTATNE
jgi:hypothetical protein